MPSFHWSSNTAIRMCYQYITIQSATHGIYVHPHYCFRHEVNGSKGFSAGKYTTTTKHDHTGKTLQCYLSGEIRFTLILITKISLKDFYTQRFILRNHYLSGYEYLYPLIRVNHPNKFTHSIDLIDAPPTQLKAGDLLSKYFHR